MFPNMRVMNNKTTNNSISNTWKNLTKFVKFVIILTLGIYIFSYSSTIRSNLRILKNIPKRIFRSKELWRLITCVFADFNLLSLLFGLFFWVPHSVNQEKNKGTIKYSIYFILLTFFIEAIYSIIARLLSFSHLSNIYYTSSNGIWPTLISEILIETLTNSGTTYRYVIFEINGKHLTIMLTIFSFILSGKIKFDVISGLIVAFIFFKIEKNLSKCLDSISKKIEQIYLKIFRKNSSFQTIKPKQLTNPQISTLTLDNNEIYVKVFNSNSKKAFVPFQAKGTVVGTNRTFNIPIENQEDRYHLLSHE